MLKFLYREHAGGMKFAKRSSRHYSDANAPHGPIAEAPGDITTRSAPWQKLVTSGISPTQSSKVDSKDEYTFTERMEMGAYETRLWLL